MVQCREALGFNALIESVAKDPVLGALALPLNLGSRLPFRAIFPGSIFSRDPAGTVKYLILARRASESIAINLDKCLFVIVEDNEVVYQVGFKTRAGDSERSLSPGQPFGCGMCLLWREFESE